MTQPKCLLRTLELDPAGIATLTELTVYEQGFIEVEFEGDLVTICIPEYARDDMPGCHKYVMGVGVVELFYYPDGSLAKAVFPSGLGARP